MAVVPIKSIILDDSMRPMCCDGIDPLDVEGVIGRLLALQHAGDGFHHVLEADFPTIIEVLKRLAHYARKSEIKEFNFSAGYVCRLFSYWWLLDEHNVPWQYSRVGNTHWHMTSWANIQACVHPPQFPRTTRFRKAERLRNIEDDEGGAETAGSPFSCAELTFANSLRFLKNFQMFGLFWQNRNLLHTVDMLKNMQMCQRETSKQRRCGKMRHKKK